MRKRSWVLAVSVLSTVVMALGAAPASAAVVANSFKNFGDKRCLDYRSDVGLYINKCNGGDYQKWIWNNHNAATPIKHVATGRCLSLTWRLGTEPCFAGEPQQWWWVTPRSGGQIPFIKSDYNDMCLSATDDDGALSVKMVHCTTGESKQRWRIVQ
ncbi:RICIN domain-containing protein [Lentzea sp. NPDC051213]|uniref:RICIN domain-containing protein n=1 Tax=Lentzea sp. NPDC051213 TaxID=3364126 RepID=UPI00379D773A